MTPVQINYLMIGMILTGSVALVFASRHFKRWLAWSIPIWVMLALGLIYSLVYIYDASDGMPISNPLLFNLWNNILRAWSYLTVIMYAVAFIILQARLGDNKKRG